MTGRKQKIKAFFIAFIISVISITDTNNFCNIFLNGQNNVYASSNYGTYTVGNATYSYEVTDSNTIYIEEYKGTDSKVVIPEKINGKPVTAIGVYAFGECKTIKEVVIPNSVKEICSRAFIDCTNLKKVKLSENTEYIGAWAFTYCSSLESIVIPNSVTEIWDYAFCGCTKLNNIQLSEKLTYIGEGNFESCESLESIELPDSLTEISASLFMNCRSLKHVKLPKNIECIDKQAFVNCVELESVVIPNGVIQIEDYAFFYCTKLNSIKLPEKLKYIGDYVFRSCWSLEKVKIPQSVGDIGKEAFDENSVYILYNNSYVKDYANKNNIMTISPSENIKIERKINSVLSGINDDMSDVEKVLFIHDWVVKECDYDYYNYLNDTIPDVSYKAEGVYLYETAVCSGYAAAMSDLLELVGIESKIVSSKEMNHAWNIVKIDGNWYHLDATWDDPTWIQENYVDYNNEGYVSHRYFLMSDSEFQQLKHYAWSEDAPKCCRQNSFSNYLFRESGYQSALNYYNGYWYFQKDGALWKSTISGQKEKIRNTNGYNNDLNAFIYNDYIYYEANGKIVKLNMENIQNGTPEIVYDFQKNYKGYYISEFTIKDRNVVVNGYNQNFNPKSVSQKVPLYEMILGDVNEDEEIDIKDSALIKRYLVGADVEMNEKLADVNGDGEVNIKDSALIKRKLAGWE